MPISSQTSQVSYPGNGSTSTPYPVTFRYDDDSWVLVEVIDEDGVVSELDLGDDYTLSGDGSESDGEVVTGGGAIPDTSTVRISRVTPLTQSNSIVPNGGIPTNTIVASFDKLTMLVQDIRGQLAALEARTYRVPDGQTVEAGALAFEIGTITHLAEGHTPTVTLTGDGPTFTFNFGLPTGATGGLDVGADASFGTTPNNEGGPAFTLWDQGTETFRAVVLENGALVTVTFP